MSFCKKLVHQIYSFDEFTLDLTHCCLLLHTVNYANPISNLNLATTFDNTGRVIDAGDFGRIISTSNNPRLVQIAAKFSF